MPSLKDLVRRTTRRDPEATYTDYVSETGRSDAIGFATYLRAEGHLTGETLWDAHSESKIEVDADAWLATPGDSTMANADASEALAKGPGFRGVPLGPGGRFDVVDHVGRGAMGVVHAALDRDLRRVVALKRMTAAHQLRRFLIEAQVTAQLDHPNVVPVHSLEADADGTPMYSMKLVHGRTLAAVVTEARHAADDDGPHALAERLDAFLKVCDAVAYAHSKGVLHRDLKPDNIMIGRFGEVYVMDWGIARLISDEDDDEIDLGLERLGPAAARGTRLGTVIGSPAYMSPEQARGETSSLDGRSDQFALGLVLFELVTLRAAFGGDDVEALLEQVRGARKRPFKHVSASVSVAPELQAIVDRATALRPEDRYDTVQDLADDVRAWMRDEPIRAVPETLGRRTRRWLVRHHRPVLLAAAALVAVAAFALVGLWARYQGQLADQHLAAEHQRIELAEVMLDVTGRARRIEARFGFYEGQLRGLAAAAEQVLQRGLPSDDPVFSATVDYVDPARRPPDMAPSPRYGGDVSVTWPVYTVAPGVAPEVAGRPLVLVNGLRTHLQRMFLQHPDGPREVASLAERQDLLLVRGVELTWAYVALERSGVMYMYPGKADWDDKYDPRTRPWYRGGVGTVRPVWTTPYVDLMGQGRLLSCVMTLRDARGELLGLAGVDLRFDDVIRQFLDLTDLFTDPHASLLDSDGRVIVTSSELGIRDVKPPTEAIDDGLERPLYPRPEVVQAVRARRGGQLSYHGHEADDHAHGEGALGERWIVWSPLEGLGWTLVVDLAGRVPAQVSPGG